MANLKLNYKTSYGMALCRYNLAKNKQPEILMIKKRYTYHYFAFVFGYYKKYNNKYIQHLFNNMTFGEKIDILSMKFSNMWYRIWLSNPEKKYNICENYDMPVGQQNTQTYFRKKSKFESIFLRDGGKRLKRLITNSSNSTTPWEMPKGSMNNGETELDCARREFEEETGVHSDNYSILWDKSPIISSHKDDNTIYRSVYYVAYLNKDNTWQPKVSFDTTTQFTEVEQVKWVAIDEIKFLHLDKAVKKRLQSTCRQILKKFKASIKSYYYI